MKGIVFDIQNYAIYDGPGIRTLIFLKGCPLKCVWCQNPESQILTPQISYFEEKCLKCESCIISCPNNALELQNNKIVRIEKHCTMCGTCVEACPNQVMEIVGKEMSIKDLIEIALRDKPFYDNSGGGVTISGGEPTMQIKFLLELLKTLQEQRIHTAIETCGYFNEDLIGDLIKYVDLFLFDIKHIDCLTHKEYTGVPNDKILANFSALHLKIGSKRIIPRIPLIPGVNTDEDTLKNIAFFLNRINYNGPVHLMPYNKLAKTKYEKMGIGNLYRDMGEFSEEDLQNITNLFKQHSFHVVINH
ncbi:MAG: glycyl-radical enzyme activating protein [Candidatus Lokiarchaeota archaeon]|nr:glycyl-radical enzyme activating protein [Candidatus Lokiarchaeota archaeon]